MKETVVGLEKIYCDGVLRSRKITRNIWEKGHVNFEHRREKYMFDMLRIFLCSFFVGRTFTFALGPGSGWTRNDVSLDTVCLVCSWRLRHKNVQLSLPDKLLSVDEYVLFTWWLRHNSKERWFVGSYKCCTHEMEEITRWCSEGKYCPFLGKSRKRDKADSEVEKCDFFHSQTRLRFSKRDRTERTQELSTRTRKSPIHFDWDRCMDDDQMKEFS